MSKPLIQIGDEVREMTQAEYDAWQTNAEMHAADVAAHAIKLQARQSAIVKLEALGLTEAEIKALVG
jgi:hypothetical protein